MTASEVEAEATLTTAATAVTPMRLMITDERGQDRRPAARGSDVMSR